MRVERGQCPRQDRDMPVWSCDAEEREGPPMVRALWRKAFAMFDRPAWRRMPMARLRRLAMVLGALPVRVWEASSV